jgi:tetratricopeptide (TPR) repeat protein
LAYLRFVLSPVPRSPTRLDAFEKAVATTEPTSPHFRSLALAFHKELQTLADHAGVDLSLYESRVEACAGALMAAGEEERAGTLFLRVGRRHQAAELFVAAGALDQLEEAHAQIQGDEGGKRHEARMSFERFEALFLVGMREPALLSLERAHRLWPDNPVYAEIFRSFTQRLGSARRLVLTAGKQELVVVGGWPVVIGRGEGAGVRLTSPLISRAHLQIELEDGADPGPVIVDLESRGGTRVGGAALTGRQPLPPGADIDMGGLVVHTARAGGALWMWPALTPEQQTVAAMGDALLLPVPSASAGAPGAAEGSLALRFDARGRAVLEAPALLNGEPLRRPTVLLEGDKLAAPALPKQIWTVARR